MDALLPFRIAQLFIHPIKACAGTAVPSARVGPHGLAGDREWAVVDDTGALTWQGALPRLALVQPELTVNSLVLHGPGGALDLPRHAPGTATTAKAWNDQTRDFDVLAVHDAGDEAARWLSDVAGAAVRLVRLSEAARRRPVLNPLHLLTTRSLAALDERLAAAGGPSAAVERFRPNLVIAADERLPEFCEDLVARLELPGGIGLDAAGPCVRCVVPNVDPRTAAVGAEPLAAVTAISAERDPGGPVVFGSYLRPEGEGLLHVGMEGTLALRF